MDFINIHTTSRTKPIEFISFLFDQGMLKYIFYFLILLHIFTVFSDKLMKTFIGHRTFMLEKIVKKYFALKNIMMINF